ncbi:hypothetical protein PR048_007528 [Dryococelus australis]|uniref:Adenylate kinase n=1 Tax=Dryococelus australis TaxID=614101 RepID=A0ABQ9HUH2_9NEOP|nr:hypothetical protein PR048_007528 [Dryococelus australis]
MFDEEAARVEVLQSKPTCFLVLGEPGSEARHLARSVADHWGCIAISPDDVLSSELEQQSDVAAHVRNRLRGGHAVPPDVVWALVELAVHSGEVQHRGYVLSGVPLTPLGDAPPSVEEQMESIFGWSMKPDILICITCPHEDIAYKRSELKYDFHLGKEIDGMIEADSTIKVIYIRRRSAEEDQIQYKHLVRLTHNFPHSVMTELSDYKHNIQPTIDIYIDSYPPDRVVRLDGRASYRHMFNCVKEILNVFPLNRVYRVHSMMRKHHVVEHSDESEYLENEEEGFQNQSIHESIPMFVIKDMISSKFQWRISRWGTTCPVSLFEGSAKEGNVEHAVRFMDKLFFLYSALEQDKFTKNPRLYISPPAPRPTGKFVIIGPALSGKTTISRFVAEIFSCKLLNVDEIRQVLKENELKKILTNEAREKLRGQLEKEWNEEEKSRLENIQNWKNMIVVHLEKLKDYSQRQQMPSSENETHSETPEGYPKDTENSENFSEESNIIESRDVLKKFGFPLEDDMKFAVGILNDPELLTDYIPEHLMTETPFVEHTDENDSFIANYVNSAIHKMKYEELEVPPDAVAAKILEAIQEAEQEKLTATHGYVKEGGWIFDEFPLLAGVWNLLEENNRLPDHIVCLTDDDPDEISLRDKWENMDPKSRSKFMYKSADGPFLTESTMLQATEDETSEHEVETSRELHSFSEFVDHYHHLGHNFSEEWKNFINLVNVQQKYIEISISGRSIEQVKADVIKFVEFQFIEKPSEISEDYGLDEAPSQLELNETELESDNFSVDDNEISKRSINMRYRMGDTGINCPVVFKKYWVLWPGSDNFAVNYMGNAFLLSSETALEEFKQNPHHYGCHYKPFIDLPPPRICIIGTIGSGKSDIRNFLAKHLVLSHFDYHDLIKEVLLPTDVLKIVRKPDRPIDESIQETYPEDVTAIREYLLSLAPLPEEMLDRLLPKFWHSLPHKENGFILEGFPHQEKDVEFMKSRVLIPDIVIELQADVRNTKKRLQSTYFNTWLEEMTKTKSDWYTQLHESRERWQRMRGERRQELYRGRHGGAANEDGRENGSLEEVEKEDIDEVELLLDEELPEPPATPPEWETAQEATDRILEQIESWFEIDRENMEVLKELARQANIPWSTVSADRRPALVRREVLHVVQSLARKQSGVLYRPVPLTAEQAESLLECGYLLPSQFSRHCPVRLHEGASLDETVVSWNLRQQPVPVAFKGRVFFLSDDRSFNLFCADPIR